MKKDSLIIVCLFFIALLMRFVKISNFSLYPDEYIYQMQASIILANNWVPTAEMFRGTLPFLSYIGSAVTLLFKGDLNTLRMISVIFGSLTVPMLYLFGKALYDRNTGLLSALFLSFSAYHNLYSRIFMCEAITIFFITAFVYFFWLSQCSEGKKSITYAALAGAMMGLATDIKLISLVLFPAALVYVLWTRKLSFKPLMDKRIILVFIFAFLFASPLVISLYTTGAGLQPIYHYTIEKFGKGEGYPLNIRVVSFPLDQLLERGIESPLGMLAWNAWLLPPYWESIFLVSVLLLILITFLFYSSELISKDKNGSFLLIFFVTLCIPILFSGRNLYYLLYLLIFLYVMLSHLAVKSFEHLRKEQSRKNIYRLGIVLLTIVMLFSSFVTGVVWPYFGEDEFAWTKDSVEHIKKDIIMNDYKENIIIGIFTFAKQPLEYQVQLNGINASTISLLKRSSKYEVKRKTIDLDALDRIKPNYLVVNDLDYGYQFNENIREKISTDYRVIYYIHRDHGKKLDGHTRGVGYRILKRVEKQPTGMLFPIDTKKGEISLDLFKRSIPNIMKVGKTYRILVQVRNTGDSRMNFTARVFSEKYIFFGDTAEITLNKGSTRMLIFKIIPLNEYVEELPIIAELYAKHEEIDSSMKKVDSVLDYVYRIDK